MLDDYLIHYCAPALAGLKPANLFACPRQPGENAGEALSTANNALNGKGVYLETLRNGRHSTLILLYRKTQLEALLHNEKTAGILWDKGYPAEASPTKSAYCSVIRRRMSPGSS